MHKKNKVIAYFMLLTSILLTTACNTMFIDLNPGEQKPISDVLDSQSPSPNAYTKPDADKWYERFADPVLNDLIREARAANYDMLSAMVKVNKAQALLNMQQAERLPEIEVQGGSSRIKSTENVTSKRPSNNFNIAAVLSYQLDLWGAVANANKAAQAALLAAEYNRRTVELTVSSEVAQAYFTLIALEEQSFLLERSIAIQEEIYKLKQDAFQAGTIDILTLNQAERSLRNLKQQLPTLAQQTKIQENVLAVLVGRSPKDMLLKKVQPKASSLTALPIIPVLVNEASSRLLTQRPDIQREEQKLIAANANIGVARAAYFPQVSLGALVGLSSAALNNLLNGPANWQGYGSFIGPVIDFGRTQATVDNTTADKRQAELDYQNTVRTAFAELVSALSLQENSKKHLNQVKANCNATAAVWKESANRYKVGYDRYEAMLVAEQNYLDVKSNKIDAHLQALNAVVDTFEALGGSDNDNANS